MPRFLSVISDRANPLRRWDTLLNGFVGVNMQKCRHTTTEYGEYMYMYRLFFKDVNQVFVTWSSF